MAWPSPGSCSTSTRLVMLFTSTSGIRVLRHSSQGQGLQQEVAVTFTLDAVHVEVVAADLDLPQARPEDAEHLAVDRRPLPRGRSPS